jgi:hypothetical protein
MTLKSSLPSRPKSTEEVIARYGSLKFSSDLGLHWPEAPKYIQPLQVPTGIVLKYGEKPVYRIFCNKDMHPALSEAFKNTLDNGSYREFKTFDGCFNVRWVRGVPGSPSLHSWGLALDFNARDNPLGGHSSWSGAFVDSFKSAGFIWGGEFSRPDAMHFQWVG